MDEEKILEELGLTPAESKVYLALLETGLTLAGPIIKKTKLHRATAYQILQKLIEKGLACYVSKSGKREFEATSPEILLELLEEQEEQVNSIIPALIELKEKNQRKQEVRVYSGVKKIKSVCEEILDELKYGGEYLDFGVSGLFGKILGPYFYIWQEKKKNWKINAKCIFNEDLLLKNPKYLKDFVGEAKFHPKEHHSPTDTMIFKDIVVMFIWTAEPPIAIVIDNPDVAESYRNQFKVMWKNAKKKEDYQTN
ncbi:TrmB family transcriptional regulator [Candidatus Woesearchaeota archaeon]|jgi:HTH-type transcriptional regulator, sugar sensing transcriptional regulator|nr:TrmB family transcriptional regulator [Candidatus Woesearchaeota archaeon]MBT6518299.1 TrmB family transcriptional regulator [Candidatus Woesearchaeota archaeon]MBT7367082.1 TrmB family transcriptional regulator [Candidatus Woesearchaeota archaeon]